MKKLLVILIGLFMAITLSGCAAVKPKVYVDILPKEKVIVIGKINVYSEESRQKYYETQNPDDIEFSGNPSEHDLEVASYLRKAMEKRLQEAGFIVIHESESLPAHYMRIDFKMVIRPANAVAPGTILGSSNVYMVSDDGEKKLSSRFFAVFTSLYLGDAWSIDQKLTGYIVDYMKETFLP